MAIQGGQTMKYKILLDYGSEGYRLEKTEYDVLDNAVKIAVDLTRSHCSQFLIISIIDWEAVIKKEDKP